MRMLYRAFFIVILCSVLAIPAIAGTEDILRNIDECHLIISGKKSGNPADARKELQQLLKDLSKEEGYEQVGKAANLFIGAMADLKGPLEDYYKNYNRLEAGTAYLPKEVRLAEIASQVKGLKEFVADRNVQLPIEGMDTQKARAVYEFGERMVAISGLLGDDPEPAGKKLSGNLKALGSLMSNLGGSVPLIGSIIAGYGDVLTGMVDALDSLEKRLNAQNPWINEATRGAFGNNMMIAWQHQVGRDLTPVLGMRDVYYDTDAIYGAVWLYHDGGEHIDRETGKKFAGNFIPINRMQPFANHSREQIIQLLHKRYAAFQQAGIAEPTPEQILWEAGSIVRLEVEISHGDIDAGDGFPVRVLAYRAVDGAPLARDAGLTCVLRQDGGLLGFGDQEQTCPANQYITWTAPKAAGLYQITADLDDAAKKAGWKTDGAKPAPFSYVVGEKIELAFSVPLQVIAGTRKQPVPCVVSLTAPEGAVVESGTLTVSAYPAGVLRLARLDGDDDDLSLGAVDGPLLFQGRPGERNELKGEIRFALVPPTAGEMPAGAVRIIAEYDDETGRLVDKRFRRRGRVVKVLRVQQPVEVETGFTASARLADAGRFRITVLGNTPELEKLTVGAVRLTGLGEGFFVTARGGADTAAARILDGAASFLWTPPKTVPARAAFRLEYSGAALDDRYFIPAETEISVALNAPGESADLFAGTEYPAPPAVTPEQIVRETAGAETAFDEMARLLPDAAGEEPVAQPPPQIAAPPVTPPATPPDKPVDLSNANFGAPGMVDITKFIPVADDELVQLAKTPYEKQSFPRPGPHAPGAATEDVSTRDDLGDTIKEYFWARQRQFIIIRTIDKKAGVVTASIQYDGPGDEYEYAVVTWRLDNGMVINQAVQHTNPHSVTIWDKDTGKIARVYHTGKVGGKTVNLFFDFRWENDGKPRQATYYDANGNRIRTINFVDGARDTETRSAYYDNNKEKYRVTFNARGEKVVEFYYNEAGKVERTVDYQDGKPVR